MFIRQRYGYATRLCSDCKSARPPRQAGFDVRSRTLGLSRASSRSEVRAEAVGVGCRPMLGREARPPWPHSQPYTATRSPAPGVRATPGSALWPRPRFLYPLQSQASETTCVFLSRGMHYCLVMVNVPVSVPVQLNVAKLPLISSPATVAVTVEGQAF